MLAGKENHMREISKTFLNCLKTGFLAEITERVKSDRDLSLDIRDSYINVYFKGNSLLRLMDTGSLIHYKAEIEEKFLEGINLSLDFNEETVPLFIKSIPFIKENIIKYGQRSIELEYEQMIIRANNFEPRNNTEYFIVDRQYVVKEGRFDLTGIHWKTQGRQTNRVAEVCLMEIKFALNADIQKVHEQLKRYYGWVEQNAAQFAEEMEHVFKQKLTLGLFNQDKNRLAAMKELAFSKNIDDYQFILVFVDYNKNSSLLKMDSIESLPFAKQVMVFHAGFGMWQHNVSPVLLWEK
jgi:hypothetical protein